MTDWIRKELQRSFTKATQAGEARLAKRPQAVDAYYDARKARLVVELSNGVILMLPPHLLQGLQDATPAQISKVRLTPLGTGLHWEELDADLSVAAQFPTPAPFTAPSRPPARFKLPTTGTPIGPTGM